MTHLLSLVAAFVLCFRSHFNEEKKRERKGRKRGGKIKFPQIFTFIFALLSRHNPTHIKKHPHDGGRIHSAAAHIAQSQMPPSSRRLSLMSSPHITPSVKPYASPTVAEFFPSRHFILPPTHNYYYIRREPTPPLLTSTPTPTSTPYRLRCYHEVNDTGGRYVPRTCIVCSVYEPGLMRGVYLLSDGYNAHFIKYFGSSGLRLAPVKSILWEYCQHKF